MIQGNVERWEMDTEPYWELPCPKCGATDAACLECEDGWDDGAHWLRWRYECPICGGKWAMSYELPSAVIMEER